MTPKERAEFLVGKYLSLQFGDFPTTDAKYCALIAVDEIWKELESERVFERYDYWQEVKKEIQNL